MLQKWMSLAQELPEELATKVLELEPWEVPGTALTTWHTDKRTRERAHASPSVVESSSGRAPH